MALQGCHNPSEKVKKTKLRVTSKDTTAKKADTYSGRKDLIRGIQ